MNTVTNATSIKTNTKEEMVSMETITNSIMALAEVWETNRATKIMGMVARAHEVDQSIVIKEVIRLIEVGELILDDKTLRVKKYECDGCGHMVSENEISIHNEFIIACEECNNVEAGKYVEDEGEWEELYDEHVESSATDMVSTTHYPCMKCSNKHMDAIEFGEEFELCDDCKLVETKWEPMDISDEDLPF